MTQADARAGALIQHVSDLPAYSPPAHSGTVNRRLVAREFGAGFEMILGHVAPGGEASRHYHVEEAQVISTALQRVTARACTHGRTAELASASAPSA